MRLAAALTDGLMALESTLPRERSLTAVADVQVAVRVVNDANVADHAVADVKALETVGTLMDPA